MNQPGVINLGGAEQEADVALPFRGHLEQPELHYRRLRNAALSESWLTKQGQFMVYYLQRQKEL